MKTTIKYLSYFLASVFLLVSCKDEVLMPGDIAQEESSRPDALEFILSLGSFDGNQASRADNKPWTELIPGTSGEEAENYINPNNFHIILFNQNGDYIKEWTNLVISEINNVTYGRSWKIRVPYSEVADVENMIRTENFKIAVLANWEKYPDFVTKDYLGRDKYDEHNGIDRNNIFYMTHCLLDESYKTYSDDGDVSSPELYTFITGNSDYPKLSLHQNWVKNYFDSDDEVEKAIRFDYRVNKGIFKSESGYEYNDVWFLWNFGGEKNLNNSIDLLYNSKKTKIRKAWAEINQDWHDELFNVDLNKENDEDGSIQSDPRLTISPKSHRNLDLTIVGNGKDQMPNVAKKDIIVNDETVTIFGVNLRPIAGPSYSSDGNIKMTDITSGAYFHFKVPADGIVKVKCETIGPTKQGNLVARRGDLDKNDYTVKTYKNEVKGGELHEITFTYDKPDETVRVTHQPLDFCLYVEGTAIRIYEIEYLKTHVIQLADRVGVKPSDPLEGNESGGSRGISMYGIQDFEALGEYWEEGSIFNLSDKNANYSSMAQGYSFRPISLLRSVAKCELYLPIDVFPKPSHVFMRTMNRYARSAPIDVFTPTDLLWYGYQAIDKWDNPENRGPGVKTKMKYINDVDSIEYEHRYWRAENIDTQYRYLKESGLIYKSYGTESKKLDNEVEKRQRLQEYKDAMAWLYGIWNTEFGWNWGGETINFDPYANTRFPRVFNTRIARTDYAHFIDGGIVNYDGMQCRKYYIYLPEKNVTDPNNIGYLDERPKLPHIEIRFEGRNGDVNFDDNACYRLYFTENGKVRPFSNRFQYDYMENEFTEEELRQLYPIVRNHIYRFVVKSISMNELTTDFKVTAAEERSVNYTFD